MEHKIEALLAAKAEELKLDIVVTGFSEEQNLHVLCKREFDNSYVAWTSYHTGEEKTSYVDISQW